MQKEEERQNRVLKEIIDNAKELPVESQNLLLILARGMVFTRNQKLCLVFRSKLIDLLYTVSRQDIPGVPCPARRY
ncbi:MAG: hypothetical protein LUG59_01340 [Enterocloster clostridioformis]|nr:hypothetical protein [Enterocloster clostridioformis]